MIIIKRIISFIILNFLIVGCAYSQDLIEEVKRQAVVIDSLKRSNNAYKQMHEENQARILGFQETINSLKSDLIDLNNLRNERNQLDSIIQLKRDSIAILESSLYKKDKEILDQKRQSITREVEAREKGKKELSGRIINFYNNASFDDLIRSTTPEIIERDKSLIRTDRDLVILLSDLQTYFEKAELLEIKFDAAKVEQAQINLKKIDRESVLLDKLITRIKGYETFNEGLKMTIERITLLDNRQSVRGMSEEIQKKKLNNIMGEISNFLFGYDFRFLDYSYLSDVVLEIIKRKEPNPDMDISDLMQKL